jgi:hypothetical protein
MTIIRVKHQKDYTCISNVAIRDKTLSFKARGIHHLLLSYPDGWRVNTDHLAHESDLDGRTAIQSGLRELEEKGYLSRDKTRDEKGRWIHESVVTELPQPTQSTGGKPVDGQPHYGEPQVGKAASILSTDLSSTQIASTDLLNTYSQDAREKSKEMGERVEPYQASFEEVRPESVATPQTPINPTGLSRPILHSPTPQVPPSPPSQISKIIPFERNSCQEFENAFRGRLQIEEWKRDSGFLVWLGRNIILDGTNRDRGFVISWMRNRLKEGAADVVEAKYECYAAQIPAPVDPRIEALKAQGHQLYDGETYEQCLELIAEREALWGKAQ